jgi:hypothetical protein
LAPPQKWSKKGVVFGPFYEKSGPPKMMIFPKKQEKTCEKMAKKT